MAEAFGLRSASRACTVGSASASTTAALSLPMISLGVPLGAKSAPQASKEIGSPISTSVGMSAPTPNAFRQTRVDTTSPFSGPVAPRV
jgi:hypothetical protein